MHPKCGRPPRPDPFDNTAIDRAIAQSNPAQRPGRPRTHSLRHLLAIHRSSKTSDDRRAASDQFLLTIDSPRFNRTPQSVDQRLGRQPRQIGQHRLHVAASVTPCHAEHAAFVGLPALLVQHRTIGVPPAQDVQASVRSHLDIGWLEERLASANKFSPLASFGFNQSSAPTWPVKIGGSPQPVIEEPHLPKRFGKVWVVVKGDSCAGTVKHRAGDTRCRKMGLPTPVRTPRMPPTVMGPEERVEDSITFVLIVVGALEIEPAVVGNIPGVAESSRHNFQVLSAIITNQNAPLSPPVISGIVVVLFVIHWPGHTRRRKTRRVLRRPDAPEFAEGQGGQPPRASQSL